MVFQLPHAQDSWFVSFYRSRINGLSVTTCPWSMVCQLLNVQDRSFFQLNELSRYEKVLKVTLSSQKYSRPSMLSTIDDTASQLFLVTGWSYIID